ncbi:HU family DNA-binding protein [Candidatus Mikella endobia]
MNKNNRSGYNPKTSQVILFVTASRVVTFCPSKKLRNNDNLSR